MTHVDPQSARQIASRLASRRSFFRRGGADHRTALIYPIGDNPHGSARPAGEFAQGGSETSGEIRRDGRHSAAG